MGAPQGDSTGSASPRTAFAPPDHLPPIPDVAAVESSIRRAIDERRRDLIEIVGAGELTIAMRCDVDGQQCVVKRMPPFTDSAAARHYMSVVGRYIDDLTATGVRCVSTTLHALERDDGSTVVFHCQPLLDPNTLADHLLSQRDPSPDEPLVVALVDRVVSSVGTGLPLDAQFANWAWFDDELWQLDLSTPFLMQDGDLVYDTSGYQREYPWLMRRLVYRELMKIAVRFVEVDWVLTDVMVQLHRGGLSEWAEPFALAARTHHGRIIDTAAARSQYEADAKFFPLLLRSKRFERGWRQATRRRYDALLPDKSSYE